MRQYLIILFCCFMSLPAGAYELNKIIISKELKKTRESTVLSILKTQKGDSIDEETIGVLRQRLIKSGIFVEEKIELNLIPSGDYADLELHLDEKISLIPIPIVSVKDKEIEAGMFLVDSNFLGLGDQLFAGGLFGKNSQLGMIQYTAKNLKGSDFDLGGGFNFHNGSSSINNTEGDSLGSYSILSAGGSAFFQWSTDNWQVRTSLSGGFSELTDSTEHDLISVEPGLSAGYNGKQFKEFFWDGFDLNGSASYREYNDNNYNSSVLNLTGSWGLSLLSRLQVNTKVSGYLYNGTDILSPEVKSVILPSDVHAETLLQGSFQLVPVLIDFSWGYLALPVGINAGYFDGISGDDELFWGPSAALTLNLKKVALPAVSIAYGWNMETETGQLQINLGIH